MKKQDRLQIVEDLQYELAEGEHTFTMCKCGRNGARGNKCFKCLIEELKK